MRAAFKKHLAATEFCAKLDFIGTILDFDVLPSFSSQVPGNSGSIANRLDLPQSTGGCRELL